MEREAGRGRRLSERLSAGAALFLTFGGAYYFVAAVNWVRTGRWPDWSVRRLGLAPEASGGSGVLDWMIDRLLSGSPGFLALLLAASFAILAVLLDRLPARRGTGLR
ncbi:MAG: hypothetical protein AMJ58_03035 [Gammaproteobacteria bacterium SG8_30]|nr:MAG: hypothetical protein AMJ58_03035 [Gammaproteobacteria bacterium SG8_30]